MRPNGVVKHIFQVPDAFVRDILEVCQSSSENYSSGPRSSFFGTVTGNGCIQIWRVGVRRLYAELLNPESSNAVLVLLTFDFRGTVALF